MFKVMCSGKTYIFKVLVSVAVLVAFCAASAEAKWAPAKGPLMTKWAKDVSPDKVHPEYPRPQMVRKDWQNLNGLWDYAIRPKDDPKPAKFDGRIMVPFPIESALSGVMKPVGEDKKLWYRREFTIPQSLTYGRIMLNFGAVDFHAVIWVNGTKVGEHKGGYDSFSFDITDALVMEDLSGPWPGQQLVVSVYDPVDAGTQPRGKQVKRPRGIWYTSVTGIWQTVWLESVPDAYIKSLKIVPDIDAGTITVTATCSEPAEGLSVEAEAKDGEWSKAKTTGQAGKPIVMPIKDAKLWSPDSPYLYDLKVTLTSGKGKKIDQVDSYFGMRKISLGKDKDGFTKMMLNNKFVFQMGPLDQGWWPDGLYTAPTDAALKYDIEVTKKLGMNMARKHVKIEPDRWYYWCDKLGLLAWQDMPSGDRYIHAGEPDFDRSDGSSQQFEMELKNLIDNFYNHPCIIVWVPFNEGWGQYDTPRIAGLIKKLDPTRLVNPASGWADRGVGDMHDIHSYPGPASPEPEEKRAIVLGEFGGLGLPIKGHTWQDEKNWGYRNFTNQAELTEAYRNLIKKLYSMIAKGLSAAVYTQTTDVEIEVNGLMTYDRAIIKMNPEEVARINRGYVPPVISDDKKIFLDSTTVEVINMTQPGEIRYTLDGTEPTKNSTLYTAPVTITQTTTMKARTFWPDGTKSEGSERSWEKVSLRPTKNVNGLKPGLKYAYYELSEEQRQDRLPDFDRLKSKTTGIADKCDLSHAQRDEYFALKFEGFIKVTTDGIYTFYTDSDDGSRLYIDSVEVVQNDYSHAMQEESGQIALKAGTYPFKLTFYQGMGGKGLAVHYKGPKIEKQPIPPKVLFHKD
jgi:hypothetical protein